ncbi:hypothetical protein BD626DRAFT_506675 [Schizophyllum amplum]|uniref:Uncharacterized protein n=1 Tax=Schizophyllum amplum TaxID=97359 RepID=A0A550C4Z0_9AGAR|nr:hypothetical protein BD626DRAFT_506675 [Auriculariopsis ampla]
MRHKHGSIVAGAEVFLRLLIGGLPTGQIFGDLLAPAGSVASSSLPVPSEVAYARVEFLPGQLVRTSRALIVLAI